jgi:hypothetical protein
VKKIIAVDPGASGGIAWTDGSGSPQCVPMPETEGDVMNLIREIGIVDTRAVVELVGGFVKGNPAPGSTMFNFGRGFGFILGALAANYVPVELVRPQKWQKHFSLGSCKESGGKTPWKNKLKAKAQQLFPEQDVTLKTADALLILEYARQTT